MKRKIVEDVVPEELDFRVTRLGGNYEIKGRYKRPTIGFEPIAKVRIRDCRITDLIWR